MAPLADLQLQSCIRSILADWYVTDAVTIKPVAEDWAARELSGFNVKALAKLMHQHVQAGGVIDQVRETRLAWNDRDYHYDFRIAWAGRALYVEGVTGPPLTASPGFPGFSRFSVLLARPFWDSAGNENPGGAGGSRTLVQ